MMKRHPKIMDSKNSVTMSMLSKMMFGFNAISITMQYLPQKQKNKPIKFVWNHKRPFNMGVPVPDFKTYNAVVTKTAWYWNKHRHTGQRKRTQK